MREILFRGKRLDNGEWAYGGIRHDYNGILRCIIDFCGGNPVDPATVGQYTGLTDKNGKRIFEGDLCLCNRNIASSVDKQVFEIVWDEENALWYGDGYSSFIGGDAFCMCEVIGNIHDNRDLLEENNGE